MLFGEPFFIFGFLPTVLALLALARRFSSPRVSQSVIVACSIAFYATWDARSIPILVVSLIFTFFFGRSISRRMRTSRSDSRVRRTVAIGVTFNLLALLVPKYWSTLSKVVGDALNFEVFGRFSPWFPVGMSFFAFTQIAYLIDLKRGKVEPAGFLTLCAFVSFFPHLIAGPVLRPSQTIGELENPIGTTDDDFERGVRLLIVGIAKKSLIADPLGAFIQPYFVAIDSGNHFNTASTWLLMICYALQLYFDFSGYSQMAIGLALMMGFRIPVNFDAPYRSLTIIDFWKRWHISLSSFLRDYLYIPLGGNRRGMRIRYRNLLITMVLGGMWHGSTLNFVLWGSMHGLFLVVAHACAKRETQDLSASWKSVKGVAYWMLTMVAVIVAWVPFRVGSIRVTLDVWYSMFFGVHGVSVIQVSTVILPLFAGVLWVMLEPRAGVTAGIGNKEQISNISIVWMGLVLLLSLLATGSVVDFLYARF